MRTVKRGGAFGCALLLAAALSLSACQPAGEAPNESGMTQSDAEREAEMAAEQLAALGGPANAEQRALYEGEFHASGGLDPNSGEGTEAAWELRLLNDYAQFARPGLGEDGGIPGERDYRERGMRSLVYTAKLDDRAGGRIASRIGISAEARHFGSEVDLYSDIATEHSIEPLACVLIDESQFLATEHVKQLARVVDELNIPVLCYGLRTDFLGRLFEGSAQLLAWADNLVELKTVCHCGKKATMVVRVRPDGSVETTGAQVEIGGNDRYVPLCRRHFTSAITDGEL